MSYAGGRTRPLTGEEVAELKRIKNNNGGVLRSVDVVKAARSKSSPLHDRFEWDDTAAAEMWRIKCARDVIALSVTILPSSNETVRAYVSLPSDRLKDGGGYRTVHAVMNNAEMRAEVLAVALREIESWCFRYKWLKELQPVFDAIEEVAKKKAKAVA